jgi:Cu-Zn family superoxide dismutase
MGNAANGSTQWHVAGRWPAFRSIAVVAALLVMVASAVAAANAQAPTGLEANKDLVKQYYDAVNRGDPTAVRALLDGEAVSNESIGDYLEIRTVFPDFAVEVDTLVAEGNTVVASVVYTGTHLGSLNLWFMDAIEPTGRPITVGSMEMFTIENGKIVRFEERVDFFALLWQVGVTPVGPEAGTTPLWSATARLRDVTGKELGVAYFAEGTDGTVTVELDGEGLSSGDHGLHIHETGTCDPAGEKAFTSAGGHFNPSGSKHGEHAGDLGNLPAQDWFEHGTTTDQFTLSPGATSILDADGSTLVIHADPDDGTTDPAGNAGPRHACGVIVAGLTAETP